MSSTHHQIDSNIHGGENADLNAAKNILKLGIQQLKEQGITVSFAQTDHSNWLKNNLGKHYKRLDSK